MKSKPWALSLLAGTLALSAAFAGEIEWIGGAGTSWATGANWDSGIPPGYTGDIALFEDNDQGGLIVLDTDRTITGLYSRNPIVGRTDDYVHTLDLGGHALTVASQLHMQQYWNLPDGSGRDANHGLNTLVISNGTFRVGTADAVAEILFGRSWDDYYYARLVFGTNTVFDGHIGELLLGQGRGGWGQIDFRNVSQMRCGDEIGVFRAHQVRLGIEGHGSHFRSNIELLFGPALTSFEALDNLQLAYNEQNTSWIGQRDGNGTAPLPAGTDVKFGVDASRRAAISIGHAGYWPTYGHFAAGDGGDCTAWVSSIHLGNKPGGADGTAWGALYLDTLDSVWMDVSGAVTIGSSGSSTCVGTGRLALPPGVATFNGPITLGSNYGSGELLLDGTIAVINNTLSVGSCGVVSNLVQGTSCGLDIAEGAPFTLQGKLHVVFAQPDASQGTNGVYWGFRIAGDHSVSLAQLRQAGKIVIDDTQIPGSANIYYDADAGFTYIAHRASGLWAPTVVTRPLDVEVDPDTSTVFTIDVRDVDLSPEQEGMTITFTGPMDQTPGNPSIVTLPPITLAADDLPLLVSNTLTYTSQDMGSTEAVSELTVRPLRPRSTAALSWTGDASLAHHYRPDWRWSGNWSPATGGPAAETPATLLFPDASQTTNRVDRDRQVGGIFVQNTSGTYLFDLDGKTLTVTNHAYSATLAANNWAALANTYHEALPSEGYFTVGSKDASSSAIVAGGTLKFAKGGLLVDSPTAALGDASRWSRLTLTNTVVDADFGTLCLPTCQGGAGGCATLDIRGATVKGGILRAENLLAGYGHYETQARSVGQFAFGPDTGVTNIVVPGTFLVSFGHRIGHCRFGDPDADWKLPANVSFDIGTSAESRGNVYVGWSNWGGDSGLLEASSGGTFAGWLDEFVVGHGMPGYLRLAAMDGIDLDAQTFTIGTGGFSGSYGEATLPAGRVRCDIFQIGQNGAATLTLHGTEMQVDSAAAIGNGDNAATVTTVLDGTSAGLRFAGDVTPAFGNNGVLHLHYAAPMQAKPYSGICFEGSRETYVEELLAANKITVTAAEDVDISKVKVYVFRGDTYVGIPPEAGTLILLR